mmetsp:Transcript_51211/g.108840  ORF Transcript_51211/g.108840 Transcript_51211/m.108840 type:complete len:937 (-) Transcript_51211:500-3310(-)
MTTAIGPHLPRKLRSQQQHLFTSLLLLLLLGLSGQSLASATEPDDVETSKQLDDQQQQQQLQDTRPMQLRSVETCAVDHQTQRSVCLMLRFGPVGLLSSSSEASATALAAAASTVQEELQATPDYFTAVVGTEAAPTVVTREPTELRALVSSTVARLQEGGSSSRSRSSSNLGSTPNVRQLTAPAKSQNVVQCVALTYDPHRVAQPNFGAFLGQPSITCDTATPCQYVIQNLTSGTVYDTFCLDWGDNDTVPSMIVQPHCDGAHKCGSKAETDTPGGGNSEKEHVLFGAVDLCAALLVTMYVCWSFLFERVPILHETGFAVLMGIGGGYIMKAWFGKSVPFNFDSFSYIFLPMVIFQAGYCLRKKEFFRYSFYILALGFTGTVFTFFFNFFGSQFFQVHDGTDGGSSYIYLSQAARLKMAAVMASTDTVAPIAFIPAASFPQVYAVVFGEGILNDVVSMLLSASVEHETTMPPVSEIFGRVCMFLLVSLGAGLVFGLGISLLFKYFEALHDDVTKTVVLLLGLNYACYIATEMWDMTSSVFSLFVCALCCGHYGSYSLSPQARLFTQHLAEMLGYTAEAVVFGYFGLCAVAYFYAGPGFQIHLIVYYLCCIFLGRFLAVLLMTLFARVFKGCGQISLRCRELVVVWMSGTIRGTIAYALILRSVPRPENQTFEDKILVTTTLGIVMLNSLVIGGLFPILLKCLRLEPKAPPSGMGSQVGLGGEHLQESVVTELPLPLQSRQTLHECDEQDEDAAAYLGSYQRERLQSLLSRGPEQLRRGWKYVDNKWFKDLFRPSDWREDLPPGSTTFVSTFTTTAPHHHHNNSSSSSRLPRLVPRVATSSSFTPTTSASAAAALSGARPTFLPPRAASTPNVETRVVPSSASNQGIGSNNNNTTSNKNNNSNDDRNDKPRPRATRDDPENPPQEPPSPLSVASPR